MAELVDAQASEACGLNRPWRFKSSHLHQVKLGLVVGFDSANQRALVAELVYAVA